MPEGRIRGAEARTTYFDGVNASALGMIGAVTWTLSRAAFVDWFTVILALGATIALARYRTNSAWLIAAGGVGSINSKLVAG